MQRSRRSFLRYAFAATASGLGAAAWWGISSKQRAARWLRQMVADAKRSVAAAPVRPALDQWNDNAITVCWVGHATVLINFYGIRILTDPAFSSRVGISLGLGTAGPKRYTAAALRLKELPPIDVVLLSHAHMDHMDVPSLKKLTKAKMTVTAKLTRDVLQGTGLKEVTELGWGEEATFKSEKGELRMEALEVKHWGERWPNSLSRGYNGYILRREGKAILFGGDTAKTKLFSEYRSRGPYELAIMPIGAYQPWIWNHCTPEQAVEMANDAGARYIVPVHHQTFRLSDEPINEPIERMHEALQHEPERLALSKIGESFTVPRG